MHRTLSKSLATASDRLLGLLVPRVEAGACVIEHGRICRCVRDDVCPCRIIDGTHNRVYRYDCYGNCKKTDVCGCP
jgi:hypothetical protein